MEKIDTKGLVWFLGITFFTTYAIEFYLMWQGFSFSGRPAIVAQMAVAVAMFIPGIAALITRKFITKEGFGDAGLKFGNWKYYLWTYLSIPVVYALVFALTLIFVQPPDFTLQGFTDQYGLALPLPAPQMTLVVLLATLTFATITNSIPALGEEFGWRGYLLPKLLPLGKKKALLISGAIWGLWHAPLVLMGFHYGKNGWLGVLFFTALVTLIGVYFGYLRLVSGSVVLAAFAHGVFNSQFYGVWQMIYPDLDPFWGGMTGIFGILAFLILSLWVFRRLDGQKT